MSRFISFGIFCVIFYDRVLVYGKCVYLRKKLVLI